MTYFNEIVEEVAAWRKKFSGMRPKQIAEKLNLHPTGMPMGNHKGCLKGILSGAAANIPLSITLT